MKINLIVTEQMAALGDATRRSIIDILSIQPSSVVDIARQLPVSRPAVSQHLRVLKDAGLVTLLNEGTRNIYQLDPKGIAALRDHMNSLWETALNHFKMKAEQTSPHEKGETNMTNVNMDQSQLAVNKSELVNAPQAHAFKVFTEQLGSWWPLNSYHIGAAPAQTAIIEPMVGGRWFERSDDGAETVWGRVLVWEPNQRIVLTWDIGSDWKYNPNLGTEIEVRFISEGPDTTRVELEHRHLERYGDNAQIMQSTFNSERGWSYMLQCYKQTTK